ncbi:MAG: hypothetical protein M1816_000795 [Peltula sp. TS41687]|nr:MAG: hypothetical protein M1816_000795 [Peltula sp. TS41687]
MAASTGTGWAQLRQQARSLETQTETLFHTYSQFASAPSVPPKPTEEEQRVEGQLQDLLQKARQARPTPPRPCPSNNNSSSSIHSSQSYTSSTNSAHRNLSSFLTTHNTPQRESLVSQLSRLLDSESSLTSSALKQNNLSRHREILLDHRRELSRIRSLISEVRARANLLSNVRSDINAYRSNNNNPEAAEADYMLDERGRIDNSHNMVDSVLSQAYAVNENFGLQRETLASINRRIVGAASHVPGINSLIGRIGAKKRRDGVILGGFIAFCFLMVLYFR